MMKSAIFNRRVWLFILLPVLFLRMDIEGQQPREYEHELIDPALPTLAKGSAWEVLATTDYDPYAPRLVPMFSDSVKTFDGQPIELMGFMMPLDADEMQTRFILSPFPLAGCSFCAGGGGPEMMVDVHPQKPFKFTYDLIAVSGKLKLLQNDPTELFYRIDSARVVSKRDLMK